MLSLPERNRISLLNTGLIPFVAQLAISMDMENKKRYTPGSGTRGRIPKPWTKCLLDKLGELDRTVEVSKGLNPRQDVNKDIQVCHCRKPSS